MHPEVVEIERKMHSVLHRAHDISRFLDIQRGKETRSQVLEQFYWSCIEEASALQKEILRLHDYGERLGRKRKMDKVE